MKQPLLNILFAAPLFSQNAEALRWANHWAEVFGVQPELVVAVIEAESAWNPRAVSKTGAVGLMQLMPDTAAAFGVTNRFDIAENIRGGVAYLASLAQQCRGDLRLILASYNAGPGRVLRRGLGYRSPEVNRYVARVAHLYRRNRWEVLLREEREQP